MAEAADGAGGSRQLLLRVFASPSLFSRDATLDLPAGPSGKAAALAAGGTREMEKKILGSSHGFPPSASLLAIARALER